MKCLREKYVFFFLSLLIIKWMRYLIGLWKDRARIIILNFLLKCLMWHTEQWMIDLVSRRDCAEYKGHLLSGIRIMIRNTSFGPQHSREIHIGQKWNGRIASAKKQIVVSIAYQQLELRRQQRNLKWRQHWTRFSVTLQVCSHFLSPFTSL